MPNNGLELPNDTNTKPTDGKPLPEASAFGVAYTESVLPSKDDFDKVFNASCRNYLAALKLFDECSEKIRASFANKNPNPDEASVYGTFFKPSHTFNIQLVVDFINALKNDQYTSADTKVSFAKRLSSLINNLQFIINPSFIKQVQQLQNSLQPIAGANLSVCKKRLIGEFDAAAVTPAPHK